jgi:hypothetical protein
VGSPADDLPPQLIDATVLWEGRPVAADARERSGSLNGRAPDELRAGRRPEAELHPADRGALAGPREIVPEYPAHPPEYATGYGSGQRSDDRADTWADTSADTSADTWADDRADAGRSAQRLPGRADHPAMHPSEPAASGLAGSLLTGREVQDPGPARGNGRTAVPEDDLWSGWETLGRPVPAEEQLAPFGPAVPVGRPPHDQTRLVLLVLGGLVLFGLLWAGWSLSNFRGSSLIGPAVAVPPQAGQRSPAAVASPSAAPAPGRPTRPPAPPPEISGVVAIDPEGDGDENGSSAPRAIDGDPATAWRSERYGSPEFGGIKDGVGLVLDLGNPSRVSRVTLDAPGEGGTVELRTAPGPGFDGSTAVAEAAVEGGRVVLAPRRAVSTQYVLVWFTKVPRSDDGDNRIYVTEIDVR